MKKRVAVLLIVWMVCLQSSVFAADWVRVGNGENYIDSETVVKNKKLLWFWELSINEKTQDKRLVQYTISLSDPYRVSSYWGYSYNSKNQPQDWLTKGGQLF